MSMTTALPQPTFALLDVLPDKWSDATIELLRDLITQKLSALQIANAMTTRTEFTFSRNAVIGKTRRLGLALLGTNTKPHLRKKETVVTIRIRKPPAIPQPPATLEEVVANPKRLTILEIERGQCYWPTSLAPNQSAAEVRFCGHPTEDDKSWCNAHRSIGYTKPLHRLAGWGHR